MNPKDVIREMSLAGENDEIRKLLLSDRSRNILRWIIEKREASTSQVAYEFNISVQHASGMLRKMYKQLYLRRYELPQESGGYEWVYHP